LTWPASESSPTWPKRAAAPEDELCHRLIEPARQIALGLAPAEEKQGLVAAAIEEASAQAPTPELAARIRRDGG
jgi:hypothetical protein